jgi:DNA polymerase III subunit gamma/tau
MAWYNTYRPSTFADVSGQKLVKSVLENAINSGKTKHGYLLSGPKGTGKTTLARIFANQLNGLDQNPEAKMDIIELDAASNTGVDSIRQLIESAKTPPFAGKYKIYIIDEVHMLSKSAMNALLKILEEPPQYLIFLLATTNPEKLLPTVLSRLTKLNLTSHTEQDIVDRLKFIASSEDMQIDEPSLKIIAKRANGGQRDAINLLETLYSYGLPQYTLEETTSLLGLVPRDTLVQICKLFANQDFTHIVAVAQKIEQSGLDGESFLGQLLEFLLEQTFEQDSAFDFLILPVAEILDLKLPINTVISTIALVQSKLKEKKSPTLASQPNQVNYSADFTQIQQPSAVKTVSKPEQPKIQDSEFVQPKEKPLEKLPEKPVEPIIVTADLSPQNLQSLILTMQTQPKFPAMFKIFWSKIRVDSVEAESLVLTLDSPMFVEKLKHVNAKKMVVEHLQKHCNIDFVIEVKTREAGQEDFGLIGVKDSDFAEYVPQSELPKETPKNSYTRQKEKNVVQYKQEYTSNQNAVDSTPKPSLQLNINKKNTKPDQKYFYSVYKQLPENTVGDISVIPIWTSEIIIPEKTIIQQEISVNHLVDQFAEFGFEESF